ncbi:MAG TPA: type II toxin-antitoxin system RelE/ParE family toxin [Thermoanaerobaculia bacterium]
MKFHPEARADLREGKAFYRSRSPLAAVAFAHQVDAALHRIAEAPLRYPEGEYGTREHVLPSRFPYTLVYRVRDDVAIVVAVAHHSREPEYWHHRR